MALERQDSAASEAAHRPHRIAGLDRRASSAASLIYEILHAEIVALTRRPGEPISEKEIAFAHGISRTPVREALLRLVAEKLVEIRPQSGTFVARIPLAALPEAIVIRSALEQVAARTAAERATPRDIAALRAAMDCQREAAAIGDRDAFHEADEAFHEAIARAGAYPGIWPLVRQVKVQVDRYRRLTLPQEGRIPRVIAEHEAILDAVAARDPERAAAALARHLDNLPIGLDQARHLNPDYFTGA